MYKFDILEINESEIFKVGDKVFRNSDENISLTDWIRQTKKEKLEMTFPNLSSPFNLKDNSNRKINEKFLGWFSSGTNTVERNTIDVGIMTAPYSHEGTSGYQITSENFIKCISAFSARQIIIPNWSNKKDFYFAPNENSEKYVNFGFDSIVVNIFSSSSNQSSLRQVEYKDQLWDIKNEFFWMSVDKMKELADQKGYDELYNDARTSPDRYVYKLLFGEERIYDKLSPDAKAVLDKATELVEKSMELRQVMANDENHLNSWDAGYAQLKLVWKEYFQEDFKEFRQLYKSLEDRMRPLVYELGFLLK
jgi:hypothetical protein